MVLSLTVRLDKNGRDGNLEAKELELANGGDSNGLLEQLPVRDGQVTEKDWNEWVANDCDSVFLAHLWRNVLLKDEDAKRDEIKVKPTNKPLTSPQKHMARELFAKLDKDNSGLLEEEEISILRGGDLGALSGLETDAMGRVDPQNFESWLGMIKRTKGEAYVRYFMNHLQDNLEPLSAELFLMIPHEAHETFEFLDKGRQGYITKEELIRAHGGDMTLFEQLDVDHNGKVDKLEWSRFSFDMCAKRGEQAACAFFSHLADTSSRDFTSTDEWEGVASCLRLVLLC